MITYLAPVSIARLTAAAHQHKQYTVKQHVEYIVVHVCELEKPAQPPHTLLSVEIKSPNKSTIIKDLLSSNLIN